MVIFLYFIFKKKWQKIGLKMAKNTPYELKLGPDMYFYEFYQILADFWQIFKIDQFLAEKRSFSAFFEIPLNLSFFIQNHPKMFQMS